MENVGRGDEKDLAQIILHIQVMVNEHEVLLGVENLEQRRGRIAAKVHRHLVHFVQHEDRIARARLLHHLDDLAGKSADVGAAVAADLGFIPHAAERHADELAAGGLRDRHAERGLAHARRPDKAEDRAPGVLHQAAHRQELQDALLDLLQAVVVALEHLLGELEVADLLGFLLPRHRQQPVEIVARDGRFGRHRRHVFQPLQLGHGLLERVLRHAGGFDALLQLVDLALLAAPQLLLDGLDLLVEVVFFLGLFHLPLHAALDGAVDVELLDFDIEHFGHPRQAVDRIEDFEQLLLLFDGELEIGPHGIGQLARVVHPDGRDHRLVIQVLAELYVLLEQARDAADERVQLRPGLHLVCRSTNDRAEEPFIVVHRDHFAPFDALDQDFDVAVRQFQALDNVDDRAYRVNFVGLRFVDRRIVLGRKKDFLVPGHRFFQGPDARFAAYHEGCHHVRKDDHIADRHHRQTLCIGFFL